MVETQLIASLRKGEKETAQTTPRGSDANGNDAQLGEWFLPFCTAGVAKQPDWAKWLKNPKPNGWHCSGQCGGKPYAG
jgi:hypothetical protein